MIKGIIGLKIDQSQTFDKKGIRIPVTKILVSPCKVLQIKSLDNDGYNAVKCGINLKKNGKYKFIKEVFFEGEISKKIGDELKVEEVLKEEDMINVLAVSKGKGFAGVVKRHHFHGGPKTHGQSDRTRAPGSIGSTTTPGRVYKGKRMAGRLGGKQVTVKNLKVVKIDAEKNLLTIKGVVPGPRNGVLIIQKI